MNAPIISIRNATAPYANITQPLTYLETLAKKSGLPVLAGDNSDSTIFRIYNNFGTPPSSSIATAYNLGITTYDGASSISHTASTVPVFQMWVGFSENGFGENSSYNVLYNYFTDEFDFTGGSQSLKSPTYGSNGATTPWIRAGSSGNGVGMIEVKTYAKPSLGQSTNIYNFGISVSYDWNT